MVCKQTARNKSLPKCIVDLKLDYIGGTKTFRNPLDSMRARYSNGIFLAGHTPDFLRKLEEIQKNPLPPNAIPISIDVTGLYTNIPHEEALSVMRKALDTRQDKTVPTKFLISLMRHVLTATFLNLIYVTDEASD